MLELSGSNLPSLVARFSLVAAIPASTPATLTGTSSQCQWVYLPLLFDKPGLVRLIRSFSLSPQAFWQITMDAVNVSGRPVVAFHEAIIDSGTSLIIGDRPSVAEFYNAIPGSSDASSTAGKGFYTFPCSSAPAVSFTFNGISYTIGADYFNLGVVSAGSDQCVGAVMANDREADAFWIMGYVSVLLSRDIFILMISFF